MGAPRSNKKKGEQENEGKKSEKDQESKDEEKSDDDRANAEVNTEGSCTSDIGITTEGQDDTTNTLIRLQSIVLSLCDRISALESLVTQQSEFLSKQPKPLLRATSRSTQTDNSNFATYADVLKCVPDCKKLRECASDSSQTSNLVKDAKSKASLHSKVKNSSDVTPDRHDGKKGVPESGSDVKESAPRVLAFHDSVLKGVEWDRIDRGYGLRTEAHRVYRATEIPDAVMHRLKEAEQQPDCILLHVGINDVKGTGDVSSRSQEMAKAIKRVRSATKTQIVVSMPTPVIPARLNARREVYAALLKAELLEEKGVTFITHNNVGPNSKFISEDGVHPTRAGSSVLAGNVGRSLHRLFWERPRRRKAAFQRHPFPAPLQPFHPSAGFFSGPPPRHLFGVHPPQWAYPCPLPPYVKRF
jgi:hypothetical protein